jgi:hypothetical protein
MHKLAIFALVLLAGCTEPGEPEVFSTSVDVDGASVTAALAALNQLTANDIDIEQLLTLTETTKMDDEQQQRFDVSFESADTNVLYHVWREQETWVHLYFSSESEGLIEAIKTSLQPLAREGD